MNEFERKLYLKYSFIREYDAIIIPKVKSIKTSYTSKCTSFLLF